MVDSQIGVREVPVPFHEHVNFELEDPLSWLDKCFDDARAFRGKLFGRDDEIDVMHRAFKDGPLRTLGPQLILISGPTGVGKTGLARSIEKYVEAIDGGYYVIGKFDQVQRPEPHIAFVEAFTQLITRVVERSNVSELKESLVKQGIDFDQGGIELVEMIPKLKSIFEEQGKVAESEPVESKKITGTYLSSGMSTNRWKDLLRTILRAMSSPDKPLLLLLEDLQWADECSLGVLQSLLEDKSDSAILFVCTYRDDSESTTIRMNRMLQDLKQKDVKATSFQLQCLQKRDIECMLTHVLRVPNGRASSLASIFCDWTKGNVFLIWKSLHLLRMKNYLYKDNKHGGLQWDTEEIRVEMLTVADLIRSKIEQLPPLTQENVKIVACLGSKLDEDILFRLFSADEAAVSSFLHQASATWLIYYDDSRRAWCFAHDGVQERIYNLIPLSERRAYHYRIGRKLWREFEMEELTRFLFLVVGQLLLGIECMNDDRERIAVAKLCLGAGVRAFQLSNFQASYSYLQSGISLLGPGAWRDEYDLSLELYNAATEVANSLGDFTSVYSLVHLILAHSRTFEDTVRGKVSKVHALGREGKLLDAIQLATVVLADLGEPFPTNPSRLRTYWELTILRHRVKGKTNECLLRLPTMVDSRKLAAMDIMNLVFFYAFLFKPDLAPLIGCRMVNLSLKHGLSAVSCVGFGVFAAVVAGVGEAFEEANRLCCLSLSLLHKYDAKPWLARVSEVYYDLVYSWVRPVDECKLPLLKAYQAGLQSGDTEFGVSCANSSWLMRFDIDPLPKLQQEVEVIAERMELYGLKALILISKPVRQLIQSLMGDFDGEMVALRGRVVDDAVHKELEANHLMKLWNHVHKAFIHFLFGQYDEALKEAKVGGELAQPFYGPTRGSFVAIVCGLADVVHARMNKRRRAPLARKLSNVLRRWGKRGEPRNFLGKYYLLEAELAALAGNRVRSFTLYVTAIGTSREYNFLLQTAIACERTAKSLCEWGDHERAGPFFNDAVATYRQWGASTKVQHLESEMRRLGF